MDPIRLKTASLLTGAAHKTIAALESDSACAKELSKTGDVERVIKEEIQKICTVATLAEITRILFLTRRMKKTSGRKRETTKSELKKIVEQMVMRAEDELGPLSLPETCRRLLLEL